MYVFDTVLWELLDRSVDECSRSAEEVVSARSMLSCDGREVDPLPLAGHYKVSAGEFVREDELTAISYRMI